MNKFIALILVFGMGVAAAGAYKAYRIQQDRQPVFDLSLKGKPAPQFEMQTLDKQNLKLSDLKGKLVLLNFWASWCPPCRAEIPDFIKVQNEFKQSPFTILGVAVEEYDAAKAYADEVGINYPVTYGDEAGFAVAKAYGDGDGALPYSVLISKDQHVLDIFPGILNEEKLKKILKKHL